MADDSGPKNRKERRAIARESGKPIAPPNSTPKMKLAQPDRSGPKSKTLLDIYDEKKAILDLGQPFDPKHSDGKVRDESGNILEAGLGDDEPIGPIGHSIFWAVALSMIHFTFDVLVYNQYRQEIEWGPIFGRSATMLPVLFLLVWIMASKTAERLGVLKQLLFLLLGVGSGCYTIHITNRYDYYGVMKQAPPLGTLWIWSVIEMKLGYAAASVLGNLGYLWWKGYTIF